MDDAQYLTDLLGKCSDALNPTEHTVPIELMQRIWRNLYLDEAEAEHTFQQTLNDVVDWLAKHDALPALPDQK